MDNCRAPIHKTSQQRVNQKLLDTDPSFHMIYLLSSCQAFLFTIHIFLTLKNLQLKNQHLDQGPLFLSKYWISLFMKLTSKQVQVSLPGDCMDVELLLRGECRGFRQLWWDYWDEEVSVICFIDHLEQFFPCFGREELMGSVRTHPDGPQGMYQKTRTHFSTQPGLA